MEIIIFKKYIFRTGDLRSGGSQRMGSKGGRGSPGWQVDQLLQMIKLK